MRRNTILLALLGALTALSPMRADEGLWLFTHPPRKQLKAQHAFELTDALLERLQKASVMVGRGGSGSFVSADGLVLTNHHVGLEALQELSETGADLVRDGFYAAGRDKELRCAGMELRLLCGMEDVSARVHAAIKQGMTPTQASKAREAVLRVIEEESRQKSGLVSEVVSLYQSGRYQLYRYKKYTDVRLVFAPEESMAPLLDACFFRAYENDKPAKVRHHLAWSTATPANGDLVLVSGYPGSTDRLRTSADLEDLFGPQQFLRFKAISRLNERLTEFAEANPENERHARFETFALDNEVGSQLSSLGTQEKLLARIRTREAAEQAQLARTDPESARRRRQALERIAVCKKEGLELSQSYFFLESSNAFQTYLFDYARSLLRLADESAKPETERLLEYCRADRVEVEQGLLEPKTIVKEMEIVKLAESLDLFVRYAGADAELAARVLDGKTPEERARALIEGTKLDQLDVRKALMQGGRKAIAASRDPMLALARLVDARSRQVRQDLEEKIWEPCRQAYTDLMRIREQAKGGEIYPDATGSLRLSFGKVQSYDRVKFMLGSRSSTVSIGDVYRFAKESNQETMLPKRWQAARRAVDETLPLLFMCSADLVPGNSGSPVVDRQGRVVGVAAWVPNAAYRLAYVEGESGRGAVAARGILEVLDKVYRAADLVKELGGNAENLVSKTNSERLPLPPVPIPAPITPIAGSLPTSAYHSHSVLLGQSVSPGEFRGDFTVAGSAADHRWDVQPGQASQGAGAGPHQGSSMPRTRRWPRPRRPRWGTWAMTRCPLCSKRCEERMRCFAVVPPWRLAR